MIRKKREMGNQLDANSLKELKNNFFVIKEVKDVNTRYGVKPVLELEQGSNIFSVFINQKSENNLIDCFGREDRLWVGKEVELSLYNDEYYNKTCIHVDKVRSNIEEQVVKQPDNFNQR